MKRHLVHRHYRAIVSVSWYRSYKEHRCSTKQKKSLRNAPGDYLRSCWLYVVSKFPSFLMVLVLIVHNRNIGLGIWRAPRNKAPGRAPSNLHASIVRYACMQQAKKTKARLTNLLPVRNIDIHSPRCIYLFASRMVMNGSNIVHYHSEAYITNYVKKALK